jgi:hypothetical protein
MLPRHAFNTFAATGDEGYAGAAGEEFLYQR